MRWESGMHIGLPMLGLVLLWAGCVPADLNAPPEPEPAPQSKRMEERLRQLREKNPDIEDQLGSLHYTLRIQTEGDLPKDAFENWFVVSGEGVAALLVAPAVAPMYFSAMVVAGGFLVPAGIISYSHDRAVWMNVSSALSEFPFTPTLHGFLVDRLAESPMSAEEERTEVEVVIGVYGLIFSDYNIGYCLIVSANCRISRNGSILLDEPLNITPSQRSPDAPPPQCARLESFAENNGQLIVDMLNEYAELMAIMIVDRLKEVNAQ